MPTILASLAFERSHIAAVGSTPERVDDAGGGFDLDTLNEVLRRSGLHRRERRWFRRIASRSTRTPIQVLELVLAFGLHGAAASLLQFEAAGADGRVPCAPAARGAA
jgi:hypothetical protein